MPHVDQVNTQRGRTICTEGQKVHLWVSNALRWRSGPKSRVMAFRPLPVQLLEPPRSRIRADDSPCSGGKLRKKRKKTRKMMRVLWNFLLSFFFLTTPGLICSALHNGDGLICARLGVSGWILGQHPTAAASAAAASSAR